MVNSIIKTNQQTEAPSKSPSKGPSKGPGSAVWSTVTDCEGCQDPSHPTCASGFHQASSAVCT